MERWLRTDERQELISSTKMVLRSLESVHEDLVHWKWAIVALHNAAQGAMVLALRAGNDFRIMPERIAEKCYHAHREGKPWPKVRMDPFCTQAGFLLCGQECSKDVHTVVWELDL